MQYPKLAILFMLVWHKTLHAWSFSSPTLPSSATTTTSMTSSAISTSSIITEASTTTRGGTSTTTTPTTQKDVVTGSPRSTTPSHTYEKKPRIIAPINLLQMSSKEREYLAGVSSYINIYSGLLMMAQPVLNGGINPKVLGALASMTTILPRVLSMLLSPRRNNNNMDRDVVVTEGTQTVQEGEDGKYSIDVSTLSTAIVERLAYLLRCDFQNIRDGVYPIPTELRQVVSGSNAVPTVVGKYFTATEGGSLYIGNPDYSQDLTQSSYLFELAKDLDLPDYYLHDFHSVQGGFLCPKHVAIYDELSETVFRGTHRMARRMLLRPIWKEISKRKQQNLKVLDIGTGTGSFLLQLREAFPKLQLFGIDLSPAMLDFAKRSCRSFKNPPKFRRANMESIPAVDGYFDIVTHTNCFHEMPESAIRNTAMEIARVLPKGGLFLHMDAVQNEDDYSISKTSRVTFDGKFVEPYMRDWMENVNMDEIFASVGMVPVAPPQPFYASTLRCYRKE